MFPKRARRKFAAVTAAAAVATSALLTAPSASAAVIEGPWTDTSLSADERALALVEVLTLDEKVELLVQTGGNGLPEYGIPAIRGKDASNGLSNAGASTALPVGLALASTWNTSLAKEYGAVSGREAREAGYNSAAAPTIDLARTPWSGRNWEGFGEDPLLAGLLGAAATTGIQSEGIPAEVKHYNVYNQETRRAHVNVVIDERTLQEIHTRTWEPVITDANAASVMCSFNKINGEFGCGSKTLLTDILKNQLGFKGFVQTDFNAAHSFEDYNAGLDTSGEQMTYSREALLGAIADGIVSEARITDAARRVLWTMFEHGIYDNPPTGSFETPRPSVEISGATLDIGDAVAQEAGEQGTVLLKNEASLPLAESSLDSIAVIGAGADEYIDGGGSAAVTTPTGLTTILDGITARAGSGVSVKYAAGTDEIGIGDTLPGPVPVPSGVLGDVQATYRMGVNSTDGMVIADRTEKQINLRTSLSSDTDNNTSQVSGLGFVGALFPLTAEWTSTLTAPVTGTYKLAMTNLGTAKLYIDGELVLTSPGAKLSTETVDLDLVAGKTVDVRVTYTTDAADQFDGSLNDQPGAMMRLGWTPPAGVLSPATEDAAALAAKSDVAVVVVRDYTGEAADRSSMTLPQAQNELISEVVAANPRTIVVVATSGAVEMPWIDDVPAVIQAWYGGQTQGDSIASILFGDVNPSGKLPITIPTSDEQAIESGVTNPFDVIGELNPTVEYTDGIDVGYRGYLAHDLTPQFSFGHGLSYTEFAYSRLQLPTVSSSGSTATAKVTVKNTGKVAGAEVVQLYVGSLPTKLHTAERALAGFARVTLQAGESKVVEVPISKRSLQYWDVDADKWVTPTGKVSAYVGSSSSDIRAEGRITVAAADTKAPSVKIALQPKKSDGKKGWYTSTVTATFAAADDSDPDPVVEASLDGAPFAKVSGELTIEGDGSHELKVRARDAAGNVSKVATETVQIDTTAPTAAIDVTGTAFTVTAEDATSGVATIEYRLAPAAGSTKGWKKFSKPVQLSAEDLAKVENGTLVIEYRAVDVAGNAGAPGVFPG